MNHITNSTNRQTQQGEAMTTTPTTRPTKPQSEPRPETPITEQVVSSETKDEVDPWTDTRELPETDTRHFAIV